MSTRSGRIAARFGRSPRFVRSSRFGHRLLSALAMAAIGLCLSESPAAAETQQGARDTQTGQGKASARSFKSSLTVHPRKAATGDEIAVVAEMPAGCRPTFLDISETGRLTPIPTEYFKTAEATNARVRYEISPSSRYGLVIQEQDPRGDHWIGFFCSPETMADAERKGLLRTLVGQLKSGESDGVVNWQTDEPAHFRFATYRVE